MVRKSIHCLVVYALHIEIKSFRMYYNVRNVCSWPATVHSMSSCNFFSFVCPADGDLIGDHRLYLHGAISSFALLCHSASLDSILEFE